MDLPDFRRGMRLAQVPARQWRNLVDTVRALSNATGANGLKIDKRPSGFVFRAERPKTVVPDVPDIEVEAELTPVVHLFSVQSGVSRGGWLYAWEYETDSSGNPIPAGGYQLYRRIWNVTLGNWASVICYPNPGQTLSGLPASNSPADYYIIGQNTTRRLFAVTPLGTKNNYREPRAAQKLRVPATPSLGALGLEYEFDAPFDPVRPGYLVLI